jgi:SulP family sulfate permease
MLINRLSLRHWRNDIRGGLQAAAVALPMGIAFGVASGAGPVAGIYSAVCAGFFAATFGGTPTQISGPTGPIAIVMAAVLIEFADQPVIAFAVVMLAGVMQLGFGVLRMGRYINLIPYPVTSGFSSAVGCIIIVMQLNPLLGHAGVADTYTAALVLPESIRTLNPTTLVIALLSFSACMWLPAKLRQYVPVHFSVLVAGTIACAVLGIQVPRFAAPESLLPNFSFPPIAALPWQDMWLSALVLALISSLDSLVTSVAADNATQEFHNSDKELLGQGLGNIVCGLIGALPGSGSTFRTMANIRGGGRTTLSGISHSAILLLLLLSTGFLIQYIPACVLSGILVYIGVGIIDWTYIRKFPTAPRTGVLIMLIVWVIGLFINVVTAVVIGVIISSLALIKKIADLQLAAVGTSADGSSTRALNDEELAVVQRCKNKMLYIHLAGPVTFGAANELTRRIAAVTKYKALVLDFGDVPHIDESAVIALDGIIRRAQESNQKVVLVGLRSMVIRAFIQFDMLPAIKRCARFKRRFHALRYAETFCEEAPET